MLLRHQFLGSRARLFPHSGVVNRLAHVAVALQIFSNGQVTSPLPAAAKEGHETDVGGGKYFTRNQETTHEALALGVSNYPKSVKRANNSVLPRLAADDRLC